MARKIILPGSFDPAHKGHLNTAHSINRIFGTNPVISIGLNLLKGTGLFTLGERLQIAKTVFCGMDIIVVHTNEELLRVLEDAELFVRGYASVQDVLYVEKLLQQYGYESLRHKLVLVPEIEPYSRISSTLLKDAIRSGNDEFAREWLSPYGYQLMKERLQGN